MVMPESCHKMVAHGISVHLGENVNHHVEVLPHVVVVGDVSVESAAARVESEAVDAADKAVVLHVLRNATRA